MTARVLHADLWGRQQDKYAWLMEHDLLTTTWTELVPSEPLFLFTPEDRDLRQEYERGWRLPEAMNQNGDPAPGIVTTHDAFAISWTAEEAREKVRRLVRTRSEEEARQIWRLCSQSQWNYDRAKSQLKSGTWEKQVKPILYRPFDLRWTVYDPNVAVHRRERVMRHMLAGQNLGIVIPRRVETAGQWQHVTCTRFIADHVAVSSKTVDYILPLYLSTEGEANKQAGMAGVSPWPEGKDGRRPNLNPQFTANLGQRLDLGFVPDGQGDLEKTFGTEDVFHYIYAVFHSPAYRARYAEFLKMDFPRIPLTSNPDLFRVLVAKGKKLADLHLLESPVLRQRATHYPVPGDNVVEPGHPRYLAPGEPEPGTGKPLTQGRVYISRGNPRTGKRGQYIEGVPPEVWEFQVGGYQVCDKWLKDRRGRALTNADIEHYEKVVVALEETIRLMAEIDAVVDEHGGWPLL